MSDREKRSSELQTRDDLDGRHPCDGEDISGLTWIEPANHSFNSPPDREKLSLNRESTLAPRSRQERRGRRVASELRSPMALSTHQCASSLTPDSIQ